ncbi:uncharacterized protein LOC110812884 isoform X3 [Carica papaya]|uniref:uncharacterized protein LOC110812884 isoform X3 n=1 Tax=Carica papaya TaxID=3649 RepID=UPI000B8C9F52|nr:uncharacterized protein LOC110812884 isoform X3 [Carica papaya]XP_021895505.1 uncharacterized protein LOC110812884 isoform X3 [Carica papaya]XP_021895512.1 uncharacterized protein LOC110812884 isoform X3 [Carica papaya]XP_021895521.1 uncharacterized protein LOC110812884 isoform X3 [Carica papaya]XP_021895531.1 uncharacterized protein LOC110812884 isoform X3 [Carica papaya]XP_021895538.1 uncharacterized protein LOC110812884 isoform X3 [Carica papaya]XP_021895545.1 uncharacterized protein LO
MTMNDSFVDSNTIPLRSNKLIHHLMLPPMILIFPSIFVKVSIRYVGKVKENGEVFCSNISKAAFKFQLGAGDVIEGWNVGIDVMEVKELPGLYHQIHGLYLNLNWLKSDNCVFNGCCFRGLISCFGLFLNIILCRSSFELLVG